MQAPVADRKQSMLFPLRNTQHDRWQTSMGGRWPSAACQTPNAQFQAYDLFMNPLAKYRNIYYFERNPLIILFVFISKRSKHVLATAAPWDRFYIIVNWLFLTKHILSNRESTWQINQWCKYSLVASAQCKGDVLQLSEVLCVHRQSAVPPPYTFWTA